MDKHLKLFTKAQRGRFGEKQKRTIAGYASLVKLKGVMGWRVRMAKAGISITSLAQATGKAQPRISEYLNFTHEPDEETYLAIDHQLYTMEKK